MNPVASAIQGHIRATRETEIRKAATRASADGLTASRATTDNGEPIFYVRARRSAPFPHIIRKAGNRWHCPCPFMRNPGYRYCAHLGAVWAYLEAHKSPVATPPSTCDTTTKKEDPKVAQPSSKAKKPAPIRLSLREGMLAQAQRTYERQAAAINAKSTMLQNLPRSQARLDAEI